MVLLIEIDIIGSDTENIWVSIVDFLKEVLKFIVPTGSPVVQTAIDQIIAEGFHSLLDVEALLELLDGLIAFYETAHTLHMTAIHQLYQGQDCFLVLQDSRETFVEELSEFKELLGV